MNNQTREVRRRVIKLDPDKNEYFYGFLNGEVIGTIMPENGMEVGHLTDEELLVLGTKIVGAGFPGLLMVYFVLDLSSFEVHSLQRVTRANVSMLLDIINLEAEASEQSE